MNESLAGRALAPVLLVPSLLFCEVAHAQSPPPQASDEAAPPPVSPAQTADPAATNLPNAATPNPPLSIVVGQWRSKIYGFVEIDVVHDSTQAFPDLGGWLSTAIPKSYNYAGSRDSATATARNSRFGIVINPPDVASITPTLTLEADFMGAQPAGVSETSFITNPAFRLRVAAMQLESNVVDVLIGQGWELFGLQPFFAPATSFLLPVPGEAWKRDLQIQIRHTFETRPIDLQFGISANRPPQSASGMPDMQGAMRLFVNGWKGIHTPGTDGQRVVGTSLDSLAIGVSGSARRFRVSAFEPTAQGTTPDPRSSNAATGYAIAIDAHLPIVPASSVVNRSNALTLTGEMTTGTGYADLLGGLVSNGGGVAAPASSYPMIPGSPDLYVPNIQPGLVTYDNLGNLHTIDWTTFVVGVQYYLPVASGKVFVSANYAETRSANVASWADPGQLPFIFTKTRYYDANLFWDISPSIRTVLSYQYYRQTFADGETAHNVRTEMSAYFWF